MQRMVEICMAMSRLENQYGQMQIFCALESPAMSKFTHVWEQIEQDDPNCADFRKQSKELLEQLGGFRNLAHSLERMDPPAIPCLWLTLKHAFTLDEVLRKSRIGKANPSQIGKIWDIYEKYDSFRRARYNITPQPEVQQYLESQLNRARVILTEGLTNDLELLIRDISKKDTNWLKPTQKHSRSKTVF